jgi:membrane protein YqaA with SNARE-associated domain
MNNSCNPKILKEVEILSVILALIFTALFIYSLLNLGLVEDKITSGVYYFGVPGIFIICILLDLIPQMVSPNVVLATVLVAGLNIYIAIFVVIAGSTVGSILGYLLGKKYMFRIVDCTVHPKNVKKMTDSINHHGKWAVPLAALTPLPYLPVLIGALNFSKRNFIIYGLIPRAIGVILTGYAIWLWLF